MRRISKNSPILCTIRDLGTPQYWHKDGLDSLLTHQVSCRVVTKNNTKKALSNETKYYNQSYTQTHHANRYYTLNGLFNTEVLPGLNAYIPVLSCN